MSAVLTLYCHFEEINFIAISLIFSTFGKDIIEDS